MVRGQAKESEGVAMKKYIVEYLENGNKYNTRAFTDYTEAMRFYSYIRRSEWARIS